MVPRPLTGEPLALDLVNTEWVERGEPRDLFDEPGGLAQWLAGHGLPGEPAQVQAPLRQARATLRELLERPGSTAEQALNDVLARGHLRYAVRDGSAVSVSDVDPAWLPAWTAAAAYLDLLRARPERIRRCAHPACVLYFYDTSRNGTRRWCSMEGCGSRSKAARHYRRSRPA
ncbi:CGNR zinc finger domain-containing protein [Couchioplanes azureus]|uniref:CGNR zinc finger domain-containing protein n=1 Tax=Couchioplanes caeruleus TaxID=56438 RepID=UPI00166F7BCE|nr:CGNR zinc finger domain-containing protein [Couchioplanes caeruleus]GGQ52201.1 hypothetical protein GCM10010166_21440 [Couchioplanes caeruleus subsp. azureus]